jgi:hypothetical protein
MLVSVALPRLFSVPCILKRSLNYGGIMYGLEREEECEKYVRDMLSMSLRLWGRVDPFHTDILTGLKFITHIYQQSKDLAKSVVVLKEVRSRYVSFCDASPCLSIAWAGVDPVHPGPAPLAGSPTTS